MTKSEKLKWAENLPCQFFGDIVDMARQESDPDLAYSLEEIAKRKYHDDEYYSSERFDY